MRDNNCCIPSDNSYSDCADYSGSESSEKCSDSTTVIVGVVCSLVFLSVGVLKPI